MIGTQILRGKLGLALPSATGVATTTCNPGEADVCYEWGDYAQMYLVTPSGPDNCGHVEWVSTFGRRLEDCFNLEAGVHWYQIIAKLYLRSCFPTARFPGTFRYGGGVTKKQTWPIESVQREEAPFVAGDSLQPSVVYGEVVETYWLTSSGVAIHVDEDTPLFISKLSELCTARALSACSHYHETYSYNIYSRLEHYTSKSSMLRRPRP